MCDQILDEAEAEVTFAVVKDGRPMVRIEPVNGVTKGRFVAGRGRRRVSAKVNRRR
jgi:hypothetical protein